MSHEASLGIRADLFDYDFKAGFPLRKTFLRTGTDRKVSFVN